MKNICWGLFGFSVLLLLIGVYSKFAGADGFVLGFRPMAWWRASMSAVIYAMAIFMLSKKT